MISSIPHIKVYKFAKLANKNLYIDKTGLKMKICMGLGFRVQSLGYKVYCIRFTLFKFLHMKIDFDS